MTYIFDNQLSPKSSLKLTHNIGFLLNVNFVLRPKKCYNVRIYIVTVTERHFNLILWNTTPTPGLNQFWGPAYPRMHTQEWYYVSCVSQVFEEINLPTLPILGPKGKQAFNIFRPEIDDCLRAMFWVLPLLPVGMLIGCFFLSKSH